MNKRLRFDTDEDDVTVPANPSDLAVELDNTKKLLNFAQLESRQKSETITDLNNQIVRMQQHLEDQDRNRGIKHRDQGFSQNRL